MSDTTYIRFDWAFKNILRDKANFEILEGLLSVLLRQKFKIQELLESEGNQDSRDDKFNRVDIKAKDERGRLVLIEVQLTPQYDFLRRVLFSTSKTVVDHIKLGEPYENVKKVYSVNILYHLFGDGDDYIYDGETQVVGRNTGKELVVPQRIDGAIRPVYPKEVFPEYCFVAVPAFDKIAENHIEEWVHYLKTGEIREDTTAPGLQAARRKLQYLDMDQEERAAYIRYVDDIMMQEDAIDGAHRRGRNEGLEEGEKIGVMKTAARLKEMGLSVDQIAACTDLTVEEIANL